MKTLVLFIGQITFFQLPNQQLGSRMAPGRCYHHRQVSGSGRHGVP